VQSVLGSALAALGDRLFWATLRPLATCVGVLGVLTASWMGAVAFWITYNVFHLGLRWRGVAWGYREGPAVLGPSLRGRLEGWTSGLAALGAILVGVIVAELLVPHGTPDRMTAQMTLSGGLVFGLITSQRPRPSPTQWALGLGVLCAIAGWWG
jgi:mannose/fructose/N-acetylgalactosamine-specific phosphotransferase system component IID